MSAADPLLGTTVGPCQVLEVLGQGTTGSVYRAHHQALDREVALKVLDARLHEDEPALLRFRREAQAAARVNHENVARILDLGQADGYPYIVQELIHGEPLSNRFQREARWSEEDAIRLGIGLATALVAMHEVGVVHRDLKPANVVFTPDGEPRIVDFGLCLDLTQRSGRQRKPRSLGTPLYMAPEQVEGREEAGPPADVFALGVLLHLALTGRVPHEEDDSEAWAFVRRRQKEPAADPRRYRPDLSPGLAELLDRLLRVAPGERPDAGEALRALVALRAGEAPGGELLTAEDTVRMRRPPGEEGTPLPGSPPAPAPARPRPPARGEAGRIAAAFLIGLGLSLGALWLRGRQEEGRPRAARSPSPPPPPAVQVAPAPPPPGAPEPVLAGEGPLEAMPDGVAQRLALEVDAVCDLLGEVQLEESAAVLEEAASLLEDVAGPPPAGLAAELGAARALFTALSRANQLTPLSPAGAVLPAELQGGATRARALLDERLGGGAALAAFLRARLALEREDAAGVADAVAAGAPTRGEAAAFLRPDRRGWAELIGAVARAAAAERAGDPVATGAALDQALGACAGPCPAARPWLSAWRERLPR